jgi:hypothetical protein
MCIDKVPYVRKSITHYPSKSRICLGRNTSSIFRQIITLFAIRFHPAESISNRCFWDEAFAFGKTIQTGLSGTAVIIHALPACAKTPHPCVHCPFTHMNEFGSTLSVSKSPNPAKGPFGYVWPWRMLSISSPGVNQSINFSPISEAHL